MLHSHHYISHNASLTSQHYVSHNASLTSLCFPQCFSHVRRSSLYLHLGAAPVTESGVAAVHPFTPGAGKHPVIHGLDRGGAVLTTYRLLQQQIPLRQAGAGEALKLVPVQLQTYRLQVTLAGQTPGQVSWIPTSTGNTKQMILPNITPLRFTVLHIICLTCGKEHLWYL